MTCLAPTHKIWSHRLSRFVSIREHLANQAMWPCDLEHPDALRRLFRSELGRDIAGNSFTGTVVQAVALIALLTTNFFLLMRNSRASGSILPAANRAPSAPPPPSAVEPAEIAEPPVPGDSQKATPLTKRRRVVGKTSPSSGCENVVATQSASPQGHAKVVRKRILKKQFDPTFAISKPKSPVPRAVETRARKRGANSGGNKVAQGKRPSSSIWEKEMLFQEYDRIRGEKGTKAANAEFKAKKPKGYYQAG